MAEKQNENRRRDEQGRQRNRIKTAGIKNEG